MKDNDKWEKEQKISKEKEYENDLINIQKNAYDKLIKDQQDILNDKYKDMNYLTEDYLKQIKIQCGNNDVLVQQALEIALSNTQKDLTGFIATTDGKVVEMHDCIQTLVNETIKALNDINKNENKDTTITTPSIYGGTVTNSQSKVDEYMKATQDLREKALDDVLNGNSQNLSNYHNQAETLDDKYGVKLDTGGYTGDWGTKEGKLAWLHQKELVLKEDDTENVLATVKYADKLNKNLLDKFNLKDFEFKTSISEINVQIPSDIVAKNNNEAKPVQQQVTIQASFPNVKDCNEIEKAFNQMETQAIQYLRK
ncbi:hypothetical protein Ccar_13380 [Clostridium carboxidivorans P7]|uniref:Uncharacterized protein n=1 Tax=Clostridium carboxidivorans P7 TaxID=536227 RepID=C6PTH9_9CLOT|nr:hypothetical protein [Clostridium carboxidivorans]AKN31802.1 hypothetical protein Ccar_13380 [Clostridium carboxidivorans P7]EET87409.1 hypothetical protein CcarbDRAFT_2096 [Clostridium carboxidivorans P7]EFG87364.1 hypothetical protein CLCAR_2888 [Clostridium carboxidivorans P7]